MKTLFVNIALLKLVANKTKSYTMRYNSKPTEKVVSAVPSLTTLKDLKIVLLHD
jgi:hypothetical protein